MTRASHPLAPLFQPLALGIYGLFLINGITCALLLPTLSLFLAQELGVRPLLVGLPFAGIALASLGYNQVIGKWSDKLSDRRPLVAGLCMVGALACGILVYTRLYSVVAFVIVGLLSLATVSFSQIMAYSLEYGNRHVPQDKIPLFNAVVRAQVAVAWVAGPPAGFMLASTWGFSIMYGIAGILFVGVAYLTIKWLPVLNTEATLAVKPSEVAALSPITPSQKRALVLSLLGFSLMWGANNAYQISLPIHLHDNLHLSAEWAGAIMGTCAGLEIPFMLLAGYYAARVSILSLILVGGLAAMALYLGVFWATALWQLFSLQLCNAMFIGILAGLGVSIIQDLLPGRAGYASAVYTNTTHVGNLLSSLLIATVAEIYGYETIFLVCVLLVALAIIAFGRVKAAKDAVQSPQVLES